MSGQELSRAVRAVAPDAEVVLMTAYGTVEAAVAAMKDGAYDFLTKPLKRHAVLKSVQQALEKRALVQENKQLKRAGSHGRRSGPSSGQSPSLRATLDIIRQAAPSTATVLLLGESGTGKELFARAVHEHSAARAGAVRRRSTARPSPRPSSRPSSSAYERGAFTGAVQREGGPLRARARRHPLPRRGRRADAVGAGEAAPRPPGGRDRAARRHQTVKVDVPAWSPPPTRTSDARCARGSSARTSTTA